jgi:hypothetical protein
MPQIARVVISRSRKANCKGSLEGRHSELVEHELRLGSCGGMVCGSGERLVPSRDGPDLTAYASVAQQRRIGSCRQHHPRRTQDGGVSSRSRRRLNPARETPRVRCAGPVDLKLAALRSPPKANLLRPKFQTPVMRPSIRSGKSRKRWPVAR